jgi:hypothetical protein
MCRGLGYLERKVLEVLPKIATNYQSHVGATGNDIFCAIFGDCDCGEPAMVDQRRIKSSSLGNQSDCQFEEKRHGRHHQVVCLPEMSSWLSSLQ